MAYMKTLWPISLCLNIDQKSIDEFCKKYDGEEAHLKYLKMKREKENALIGGGDYRIKEHKSRGFITIESGGDFSPPSPPIGVMRNERLFL